MSIPLGVRPQLSPYAPSLARDLRFAAPPFLVPHNGMCDLSAYRAPLFTSGSPGRRLDNHTGMAWATDTSKYLVTTANLPQHKITGPLTVMIWAKKYSNNAFNIMSGYRQGAGNIVWDFRWDSSSAIFSVSSNGSSFAATVTAGRSLTTGQKYHIAATYTPSDRICIYVNGVLDGTTTASVPSSLYSPATAGLSIGTDTGGSFPFTGELSHNYVWARALSAGEIKRFHDDPWVLWRHKQPFMPTTPSFSPAWAVNSNYTIQPGFAA